MGKSSTGKDTLYKRIISDSSLPLKTVVSYTTRPIRSGERDGCEYFFTTVEKYHEHLAGGSVIEHRCYHTTMGDWYYYTVDDGQIDLSSSSYIMIPTLESYGQLRDYYGEDSIVPIYIEVDGASRLRRSISREELQAFPNYSEICRRYLADEADFSEENIRRMGIEKRYINDDFERCVSEITAEIRRLIAAI